MTAPGKGEVLCGYSAVLREKMTDRRCCSALWEFEFIFTAPGG